MKDVKQLTVTAGKTATFDMELQRTKLLGKELYGRKNQSVSRRE